MPLLNAEKYANEIFLIKASYNATQLKWDKNFTVYNTPKLQVVIFLLLEESLAGHVIVPVVHQDAAWTLAAEAENKRLNVFL